jgi:hypothetical protein
MTVFWDIAPYGHVIALMMEAVSACETSVDIYQTTRCYIPEDIHYHIRLPENLISHPKECFFLSQASLTLQSVWP